MTVIKTQGTELYILDPTDTGNEVRKIGRVTGAGEFSTSTTEITTTNLDSTSVEKINGLTDNGTVTFQYDYDPQDGGQLSLMSRKGGSNARFLLCLSESSTPPSYSGGNYVLPTDRTTLDFFAAVQSVDKGGNTDDIWRGSFTLSISGTVTETIAS